MTGVLIVLIDPLTDFGRCDPHDRVGICVVVGGTVEDFDPEDSFLQMASFAVERTSDHKPQKLPVPFT